jgi:hypothetical protein
MSMKNMDSLLHGSENSISNIAVAVDADDATFFVKDG